MTAKRYPPVNTEKAAQKKDKLRRRAQYGQCKYWPACACGPSNGRNRQPDSCGRKPVEDSAPVEPITIKSPSRRYERRRS